MTKKEHVAHQKLKLFYRERLLIAFLPKVFHRKYLSLKHTLEGAIIRLCSTIIVIILHILVIKCITEPIIFKI